MGCTIRVPAWLGKQQSMNLHCHSCWTVCMECLKAMYGPMALSLPLYQVRTWYSLHAGLPARLLTLFGTPTLLPKAAFPADYRGVYAGSGLQ